MNLIIFHKHISALIHKQAINLACTDSDWRLSVKLLELMMSRSLSPSPNVWKNIVTCCAKAGKSKKATALLLDWVRHTCARWQAVRIVFRDSHFLRSCLGTTCWKGRNRKTATVSFQFSCKCMWNLRRASTDSIGFRSYEKDARGWRKHYYFQYCFEATS